MSGFDMRSFCLGCGAFRRTMPFGTDEWFFDRDPCRKCGSYEADRIVAKRVGFFKRAWVDREGNEVG